MAQTHYIFVSGGVISAVGKGITAASIAMLLQRRGFTVCPVKCENNLNVDFGTINPIEHGDPFLCADGLESDQDLGNYERFLDKEVGRPHFMTMGQLYSTVIQKERDLAYDGEDVEPIPHVVNEIIERITSVSEQEEADFCIVELGGTVGEYENNNGLYYEAARVLSHTAPVAHVHVTYILQPPHIHEPKTKPAQFGIHSLMRMGIMPDFLVARSAQPLDEQRKYKFGLKFNIAPEDIFTAENLPDIHEVPLHLHKQHIDTRILEHFGFDSAHYPISLQDWRDMVSLLYAPKKHKKRVAIVGKYFGSGDAQLNDAYHALFHAINHAAMHADVNVDIVPVNAEKEKDIAEVLSSVDGIIVPIGWGTRGVTGKLEAIRYAREHKVPYLGLCYGMQLACVEFAQHVLSMPDASSEEIDADSVNQVIHSIPFDPQYQTIKGKGSSMRIGTFSCVLQPDTLAAEIYQKYGEGELQEDGSVVASERHRHRFEFNNAYREQFEKAGFVFSGVSPDNFFVEMIELPRETHPFFIATQAHPEYRTYPNRPHPLFSAFIEHMV